MSDDHQLAELGARRIDTDTDPDELVLPEESGQRLGWIANWLAQPPSIFREWGLSRYVDGGLRALFRGPSGTGKTMAAVALAKSTGRPLYQVELSLVISRYVGETEKKLRQLLEAADGAGAVLLFDEADAMFGKRGEVKDSHDRDANSEVSYLLQRMEPFAGLAILTANLGAKMEAAALNRIDVMVDFPLPDEAAREAIWRKLLGSAKLPQGEGIDAARLAREFQLSGAEILRSVRLAALLATTDERPLNMELLQAAAAERVRMRDGQA
jgi:SpoVK/Ycf46/Vps4 family AAA+-type ATPase